jgi:hypothetical protein
VYEEPERAFTEGQMPDKALLHPLADFVFRSQEASLDGRFEPCGITEAAEWHGRRGKAKQKL